ncbi:SCO family protein [Acidocella sp.]|uniref:SCO family protein n=1 Tax=Acidocella sp. TaxID=50710 RepID=UPI00262CF5AB|nr:SCO family protein [Acidocella sp.]MDD2795662.1 SCO family protein [Acidocella sp.]
MMIRRAFMLLACLALSACHHTFSPQDVSVVGLVPDLAFNMTDVNTGKPVSAADFKGKVTLLYFGYTHCPDVCPATLYNLTRIFKKMGAAGRDVRVLFVTVDPSRDTPDVLKRYTSLFGENFIGLRGNADQIYSLARRYRVVFSVTKTPTYTVTHSAAVYVFNPQGKPQFIIAGLDTNMPDIKGIATDLTYVGKE